MIETPAHPRAARYLRDLDAALRDIPGARRREIVDEIRDHIEEASVSAEGSTDDVRLRTVLDLLGDPETIADEARERFGIDRPKAGLLEGTAIAFLLVGAFVIPGAGWLVGVVLLWIARAWTVRERLIGTFVLPGGLALPAFIYFYGYGFQECTVSTQQGGGPGGGNLETEVGVCSTQPLTSDAWGVALLILMTLLPIATAVYLGRRAFR